MKNCEFKNLNPEFQSSKGIALVLVLWVIAILSVVVLEFSLAMRTEVNITKNYKEELQLYGMAEGGIQRAIVEMTYKHDPKIQQRRRTKILEEIPVEKREWVTDGRPYQVPFENGMCEVRIISESAKININIVGESMLRKIIYQLGLDEETRDMIVDSILDWRDPDDFYRANGAENEYYQSLKESYQCKNGNIDSVEELLLIRGITPSIFRGVEELNKDKEGLGNKVGLRDLFSIYSSGEQVDINSASPIVMKIIFGIPEVVAKLIVKAREDKVFENHQDLLKRVPEISPFIKEIGKFILFRPIVPYYTIESRARLKGGESIRAIKAIVKIDPREKRGYKILQWFDSIIES